MSIKTTYFQNNNNLKIILRGMLVRLIFSTSFIYTKFYYWYVDKVDDNIVNNKKTNDINR